MKKQLKFNIINTVESSDYMKKKGFTLIELLAVIVILAIIALIATPLVLKYIEYVEKEALRNDIKTMDRAILMQGTVDRRDKEYTSTDEIDIKIKDTQIKILYSKQTNYFYDVRNKKYMLDVTKCATKTYCTIEEVTKIRNVIIRITEKELFSQVEDSDPGLIVCNADGIGEIRSIEDLVYLSTNPNVCATVKLIYNLDFNNKKSYASKKVDEGLISGVGFAPIGKSGNTFKSIFEGNHKIIKGLYINRPEESYVGLFGYTDNGTVKDLSLIDSNITGKSTVGGIVGYNNGTVTIIILDNVNVTGTDSNIGGIAGYSSGKVINSKINGTVSGKKYCSLGVGYASMASLVRNIIAEGDVSGDTYIGAVVGYNYADKATGVYLSGNVNCNASCGVISGYNRLNSGYGSADGLTDSTVTYNGKPASEASFYGTKGTIIDKKYFDDINTYELVFDTYIGGDNDNDGYYFDYMPDGSLWFKSVEEYPLVFDLKKDDNDFYLVDNYSDLKKMALNTTYKYKLTNDIDVKDKKFYMIGSGNNIFTGTIEGNNKTISNVDFTTISGGIFGKFSSATVQNLTLNNIKISGNDYIGTLASESNASQINNVLVENINIDAKNDLGGLIGKSVSDNIVNVSGKNITIKGETRLGMMGSTSTGTIKNMNINNIDINGTSYIGGIVGNNGNNILGVKLSDVNIIGTNDYIGGIAGITSNTITNSKVSGNVVGRKNCALGIGYAGQATIVKNILVSGNVEGESYSGGVVGYNYADNATGVYLSGGVTCGASCGIISGYNRLNAGYGTATGLTNANVTLNGKKAENASGYGTIGTVITGIGTQSDYQTLGFEFDSTDTNEAYWYFNDKGEIDLIIK